MPKAIQEQDSLSVSRDWGSEIYDEEVLERPRVVGVDEPDLQKTFSFDRHGHTPRADESLVSLPLDLGSRDVELHKKTLLSSISQNTRCGLTMIEKNNSRCARDFFNDLYTFRIILLEDLLIISKTRKLGRTFVKLKSSFIQLIQMLLPANILYLHRSFCIHNITIPESGLRIRIDCLICVSAVCGRCVECELGGNKVGGSHG